MSIMVLNSGSSSLKFKIFEEGTLDEEAAGVIERIGLPSATIRYRTRYLTTEYKKYIPDHETGLIEALSLLTDENSGLLKDISGITAVGHRVLHGGDRFTKSVLIDNDVIGAIEECIPFGPLHNPANLLGIRACLDMLPGVPQTAVFDTAFHATVPVYANTFAIPYEYSEKYKIHKFGFHGTSHRYVALKAAEMTGREDLRIISCHLGNGCSMAAVKGGVSLDTTMGLTPLDGLMMGTRSGSVDPSVLQLLCDRESLSIDGVIKMLNNQSGLFGVSGVSGDFRHVMEASESGNKRARLALEMFNYRIRTTIGAYSAVLGGVDAIAFTGGIGENSCVCRTEVLSGLEYLGIKLDKESNENNIGGQRFINSEDSKVFVMVIPANEELMIAMDTDELTRDLTTKQ